MTHKQFLQQSEAEQSIFFAKLIHAVKHDEVSWLHARLAIITANMDGVFDNVKFGNEIFQGNELVTAND